MGVARLTTTEGAWAPVYLADAVAYARLTLTDDQVVLERLIEAAARDVERYSGHILVPGTFRVTFDAWARTMELPITPLVSVDAVRYQSYLGETTTLTTAEYTVDQVAVPSRVSFEALYAPVTLRTFAGVEFDVTAGYANPMDVPPDIQQLVISSALLMFEHRSDPDALRKVHDFVAQQSSSYVGVTL